MNNAEKFKQIFGLYATELWSMPESDFLEWLNRDVETTQIDHIAESGKKVEGDCISRQAAIDAMKDMYRAAEKWLRDTTDDVTKARAESCMASLVEIKLRTEKLPVVQPEPKWIPCSERLPDDLAEVNVTWVNHEPEPYYAFLKDKPFTASAVYYKGKWYWYSSVCVDVLAEYGRNDVDKVDDTIEITAWMPLPEPYRGGDE